MHSFLELMTITHDSILYAAGKPSNCPIVEESSRSTDRASNLLAEVPCPFVAVIKMASSKSEQAFMNVM